MVEMVEKTNKLTPEEVEFKIKRAKIALSKDYPFFSDILFFMDIKPAPNQKQIPTICINNKSQVWYNEEWIGTKDIKQIKGLLIHESIHPAWQHILRGMRKKNHGIWNLAIDCHANMMVMKNGLNLPLEEAGCVPNVYNDSVEVRVDKWSHTIEHVTDKASEAIYDEIIANMPKDLQKKVAQGQGAGLDVHIYDGDMSDEEIDREAEKWGQRVINAAERARQQGKMPAGMERMIGDILEPKVDWRTILYQFIAGGLPADRTWLRRDRRYAAHGLYIPDQKRESVEVSAWIDTSGSIDDATVSTFKTELIGLKRQFECVNMTLGFCDADVQGTPMDFENVEESDIMKAEPKGGGGTDMRKIIQWVKKNKPNTDTVVILTDGQTPFPVKSEVPQRMRILWLICPNGIQTPPTDTVGDFVFIRGE